MAFLPDGNRVASTGADGTVRLWDVEHGKEVLRLSQPDEQLAVFDVSPDGKRLVTGGIPQGDAPHGRSGRLELWKMP